MTMQGLKNRAIAERIDITPCNLPASTPPETLGQNTHVLRPKMRVNIKEVVGQPLEQPKCKTCDSYGKIIEKEGHFGLGHKYKPCPDCKPNPNLKLITEIEGLISQVSQKIYALSYDKIHQDRTIKSQAIDDIDLFQKIKLPELRKVFE